MNRQPPLYRYVNPEVVPAENHPIFEHSQRAPQVSSADDEPCYRDAGEILLESEPTDFSAEDFAVITKARELVSRVKSERAAKRIGYTFAALIAQA